MKLYNTRTQQVDTFEPLKEPEVRVYSCGPTVYDHAHIGNLSSYIYADTLHRLLKSVGYQVRHVMNFTDVDDKTIQRSHSFYPNDEPMAALAKLTTHYEQTFLSEMQAVGNDTTDIQFVKATDSIADIQDLIKSLIKQGVAYIASDGVYFSIAKYKQNRTYGQLSNVASCCIDHNQSRINNDEYDKGNICDFALWKRQKPGEPAWGFVVDQHHDMPGRPGWHIECSVMSRHQLGQPFDIHTGGVDLIFPHHENEIAQSTAGDQPELYANFFVHNQHLLVDGKKMSKSAHNFYTLPDLLKKDFEPLDFRMLVLQSHYRNATNFSWDSLGSAKARLLHWRNVAELRHQVADNPSANQRQQLSGLLEQAQVALENDMDTPNTLRIFSQAYDLFTPEQTDLESLERLIDVTDQLLGLQIRCNSLDLSEADYELIDQRLLARQRKDWPKADQIRSSLAKKGIVIKDGEGSLWSRS